MMKLVIFSALLAIAVAAPQYPHFPVYSPYPFPYYHPLMPYTRTAIRQPIVPSPYYYPGVVPYPSYNPVEAPVPVVHDVSKTAHPQQTTATFRIPSEPSVVQPKPAHHAYSPVSAIEPQKVYQDYQFAQPEESPVQKNPSLQLADLILTPEQKRQLEEAVAAMNPLEFAARLDATKDAREAMRIFDN